MKYPAPSFSVLCQPLTKVAPLPLPRIYLLEQCNAEGGTHTHTHTPTHPHPPTHPPISGCLPTATQQPNRPPGKDIRSRGRTAGSSRRQRSQSQPPSSCRSSSGSVWDMAPALFTSRPGSGGKKLPPLSQQPPRPFFSAGRACA